MITARIKLINKMWFRIIALIFCMVAISCIESRHTNDLVYKDKKNGYFSIVPPYGWKIKEYDDTRTKVMFYHPNNENIFIRLIVKQVEGETIDTIRDQVKLLAQQLVSKEVSASFSMTEIHGVPSATIETAIGNSRGELFRFLLNGVSFNIQINAPEKDGLLTNRQIMINTIDSIVVTEKIMQNPEKARRQEVASIIRMSEILMEQENEKDACRVISDALVLAPVDPDLLRQVEKLKCKKP